MFNHSQNFWNFSVDLYAQPRVADACLDLQNTYGLDVNLLLFCHWHGVNLGEFPQTTVTLACEFSRTWRKEVVQPLRNVRQWMKLEEQPFATTNHTQFDTLRTRIKFDELAAEKYQQEFLEHIALANVGQPGPAVGPEVCNSNIEKLFGIIKLEQNDLIAIKLRTIMKALVSST